MSRLFGTDGVRGVVGIDLTTSLAMKIGEGTAYVLAKNKESMKIMIGHDGRESASMLVSSLIAGLTSMGVDVVYIGMIPTSAVSYLVKYYKYDAGIMVTASHNSYEYNGIKIFNEKGYKLADELEDEIEDYVKNNNNNKPTKIGTLITCETAINDYINYLIKTCDNNMSKLNIAVDTANGAASYTCAKLFDKLDINYKIINNHPNGTNINKNCGALHVENLSKYVVDNKLDGGVAFDGDADRAIFVDEKGNIIDGDHVLAIIGTDLKNKNKLQNNTIVGTIVTNLGFIKFCEKEGINFIASKVGDKYVLEEIITNNLNLGGEQSGHIIIKEFSNTGDGQLTAITLFNILARKNIKFSELASIMQKYPQVTKNVNINPLNKNEIYTNDKIKKIISDISNQMEEKGRIIVRPSGTEPLIRIMIEGKNEKEIENYAKEIAEVIKKELN